MQNPGTLKRLHVGQLHLLHQVVAARALASSCFSEMKVEQNTLSPMGMPRMTILGCVNLIISGGNGLTSCLLIINLGKGTKRKTKHLYDGENFKEQQTRPGTGQHTIIQVLGRHDVYINIIYF